MVSDHLTDFFNYLSIEKGLASNTTAAYRRDLERFFHYLSINQLNLAQVTAEELVGYLSWLREDLIRNLRLVNLQLQET